MQSRTFDMAARVDGRVGAILVSRSQDVSLGAPLLRIDNPELVAKERQSAAAWGSRCRTGPRQRRLPRRDHRRRKAEVDRAEAD